MISSIRDGVGYALCTIFAAATLSVAAPPIVNNGTSADPIFHNRATLNFNITSDGGSGPVDTRVYWGLTDGGTNEGAWASYEIMGGLVVGLYSAEITGLGSNTTYFYRTWASNATEVGWASGSTNFMTAPDPGAFFPDFRHVSPAASGGPTNDFFMAKGELTNAEFVRFLNNAQVNPINELGTNMWFGPAGNIYFNISMTPSERMFDLGMSRITYNASNSPGMQYYAPPNLLAHPVAGVTWVGALKYCNWLTMDLGMAAGDRCYQEGSLLSDWRPVTAASWPGFNPGEREALLGIAGVRLPMDDYQNNQAAYNEYYAAAAWDGATNRFFGFGRDSLGFSDANTAFEAWPDGTTPVGYYDGSSMTTNGATSTVDTSNGYGLYDMSGNVGEWVTCREYDGGTNATVRGGGFGSAPAGVQVNVRVPESPTYASPDVGFRVMSMSDISGATSGGGGQIVVRLPAVGLVGMSHTISLTVLDWTGAIDTGYVGTVTFSSSDPGAALPGPTAFNPGDMGVKTLVGGALFSEADEVYVDVVDQVDSNLFGHTFMRTVEGGGTNTVGFEMLQQSPLAIANLPQDVSIWAVDAYGRVDTSYTGMVGFSSSDGGASFGLPSFNGFVNGVGVLSNQVTFVTPGAMQTLGAADSVTPAISGQVQYEVVGGGQVYYVMMNGSDGNVGTTVPMAWRTIQYAESMIGPGDVVVIGGGFYEEAVTMDIPGSSGAYRSFIGDFDGKYTGARGGSHIHPPAGFSGISETADWNAIGNLMLEGDGVAFSGDHGIHIVGSNVLVAGVGITRFDKGVYAFGALDVTVKRSRIDACDSVGILFDTGSHGAQILGNDVWGNEVGIGVEFSLGATLQHNLIEQSASNGIEVISATASILENDLENNGEIGLYVMGSNATVTVQGNIILGSVSEGLVLDSIGPGSQVINNTVFGNLSGLMLYNAGGSMIRNNIILGNTNVGIGYDPASSVGTSNTYNCVYGQSSDWSGSAVASLGDFSLDPLCADLTPGNEDFHLQSQAGRFHDTGLVMDGTHSPAIDAADPADSSTNEPAPNGNRRNMGAYGNTFQASRSLGGGPLTNSLMVASVWGTPTPAPGLSWFTNGSLVNARVMGSPAMFGSTQYVATGWAGSGGVSPSGIGTNTSFTMTTNSTLTWTWATEVQLTVGVAPNGTVDVPDAYYAQGTNLVITATPTNGYVFAGWGGDVATNANPIVVTMNDSMNIWPTFVLDTNSLTVTSSYGLPNPGVGVGWMADGSLVNASLGGSPYVAGSTQHVATGWTGTGDVPVSGAGTNVSFTLTNNSSIVWNWATEVQLTVGVAPNGTVDVPDGYYSQGTNLVITATPTNGYNFVGWVGDVVTNANPLVVTLNDSLNVTPTFSLSTNSLMVTSAWGAPTPVVGTNWLGSGSLVNAYVGGSPALFGSTQYVATGWTGSGDVPVSGAGTNVSFTLTNNSSIVWNWATEVQLTIAPNANGIADVPNGFYALGTNLLITMTPTNGSVFAGWSGDIVTNANPLSLNMSQSWNLTPVFTPGSNTLTVASAWGTATPPVGPNGYSQGSLVNASIGPQMVSVGSTQYNASGWTGTGDVPVSGFGTNVSFTITNNSSVTWQWATSVQLTLTPDPNGSINWAGGYFPQGTNLSLLATPTNGFSFAGWTGDIVTNVNPLVLNLNDSITLTPLFTAITNDLVVASAYGTPTPIVGTNTFPQGSLINASVGGSPVMMGTTQHLASGWIGTGDAPAVGGGTNVSFSLNNNSMITWLWSTDVQLNVNPDPKGVVSVPNGYYPQGTNLLLSVTPTNGYSFVGWTGDIVTNANPLAIILTDSLNVTPLYSANTNLLMVNSPYGVGTPPIGTNVLLQGSVVNASIAGSPVTMGTTQYVAVGWTGTGDVPAVGAGTSASFTLNNNSMLSWNWATRVKLDVGPDPNGTVDVPTGFYNLGTNLTLTASPAAGFQFSGWTGAVPPASTNNNPLLLVMSQARNVSPTFAALPGVGLVRVVIQPAAAVGAGAQWRLTTGPDTGWKTSGMSVTNVPVAGNAYTVQFSGVAGWTVPLTKTNVNVVAATTTTFTGTYYTGNMVFVPGGPFQMSMLNGLGGINVTVSEFMMDVREVTVGEYATFAAATARGMPAPPLWGFGNTNLPMVKVSWGDASAYASWAGKRLPTEAEFEFAMRGGVDNQLYPWGNAGPAGRANFGNGVGLPSVAGSYAGTGVGLFDIAGNVWEWCSDWYAGPLANGTVNPAGPGGGTLKVARGGSWVTQPIHLQSANRYSLEASVGYVDLGFRCVALAGGGGGSGSAAGSQVPDADGDGVPDWWESGFFGLDASSVSAAEDTDRDGASNLDEFLAGTAPDDAESVFEAKSVTPNGSGGVELVWKSAAGKTYTIEYAADLLSGFSPVATGIGGAPPMNTHTVTVGSGSGFFRIRVQ